MQKSLAFEASDSFKRVSWEVHNVWDTDTYLIKNKTIQLQTPDCSPHRLMMLPWAISVADYGPGVDGTVDICWYGPDLLEKPKFSMERSCWQLMSKWQQLCVPGLWGFFPSMVCSSAGAELGRDPSTWVETLLEINFQLIYKRYSYKKGQNKKPPNNDSIWGEEIQRECWKKKRSFKMSVLLTCVSGDDWFIPLVLWNSTSKVPCEVLGSFKHLGKLNSGSKYWGIFEECNLCFHRKLFLKATGLPIPNGSSA